MGGTNTAGSVTEELHKAIQGIDGRIVLGLFKIQGSTTYTIGGDIVDLRAYFHKIQGIMSIMTEDDDTYTRTSYDDANYNTASAVTFCQYMYNTSGVGIEVACETNLSAVYNRILVIGE